MTTWDSTLKTFTAGEVLTAADLNENVRDPLVALSGAWNSYEPTLGGFTPGNGTASGSYIRVGKLVFFWASFTFGSTSAAATAYPTLTLPVTAAAAQYAGVTAYFVDIGSNAYMATARINATTTALAGVLGSSGAFASPSTASPFTWATGDIIVISGHYEAA